MNKSKLFASLAALSMTMSQTGQIQIFAKEEALKEDALLNDSYKAGLQDQILKAQNKKEETKKALDQAQKTYDDFNNETYIPVKTNMESTKNAYDTTSLQTQQAIVDALEKQVTSLETNQKELKEANEKKKVLSNTLEDATKELVDAQDKLQKAQKEQDALLEGTSKESLSKEVEKKLAELEGAKTNLANAKKTVEDLNQQKAECEAKIQEALSHVESTKTAYEEAQKQTSLAKTDLDTATSNYNEKKAIYDGATNAEVKAEYEADLVKAQNELSAAQNNLKAAMQEQTTKENAVTSAEKNVAVINQKISDLESQIQAKQKELDEYNQNIKDAQKALSDAKTQLETAKANQASKEKELETAKANLEKAEQDVTTQQNKVNEVQEAVIAQEKVVTQLRTDKEQAQTKIEQGSKGFFEEYGYTDALKILEEQSTANGGSTNIGAENDATSLENFKRALSMVRYGNNLRTTDTNFTGREDLKVNPTLFAIAQVQINATANGKEFNHSSLYNVGENITASPWFEDDKGLYEGWYDSEKQAYEYITAKGWTIADVNNDENKYNEVMNAVGHSNIQVGHYKNLIGLNSDVTGTAYVYSKTPAPDGYRCNAGQVFDYVSRSNYITDVNTMTIDEFEAQFNEYYNKLMNADSILQAGQNKLDSLKAELENQRGILSSKTVALTSAQTNVETVQNQVTQAKSAVVSAEKLVENKQNALDALYNASTLVDIQNAMNALKAQKTSVESKDLVNAQKALEVAQLEKKNADQKVADTNSLVEKAELNVKKKQDILDRMNASAEQAKEDLEAAKKDLDLKTKALKDAQSNELNKKGLYEASKANVTSLQTKRTQLNKDLEQAKKDVEDASVVVNQLQIAYDNIVQKQNDVKDVKKRITDIQSDIADLKTQIEKCNVSIEDVEKSIQELNLKETALKKVKAQIEQVDAAYKKLCADPEISVDVVESQYDVVRGLNEKLKSMKLAYETYSKALKIYLDADGIQVKNKENLDVALKAYEEADKDLASAQLSLRLYLVSQMGKGWQKMDSKWYYVDSTGRTVTNQWIGSYFFEADGTMATSKWIGNYYVDANGRYTPEQWVLTNGKYWYRHQDGSYTKNDFEVIGGQTYYFDSNGYMVNGWKQVGNDWYYFNKAGHMVKNQWIGNYYFEADGKMATSKWIGNYYVDSNGLYTPDQWVLTNGKYWYRHQDGSYTKNDFEVFQGPTYYFDGNGYMVNSWKQVGSDWYYFNKAGHMVKDQWIGDYYFGSDGKMVTNTWVGNYHVGADGKID